MAIWLVRAGAHGEQEEAALENGMAVIGWDDVSDVTPIKTREALTQLLKERTLMRGRTSSRTGMGNCGHSGSEFSERTLWFFLLNAVPRSPSAV
jgi:predicted Mrr-cat superfamily restriction endonuclease